MYSSARSHLLLLCKSSRMSCVPRPRLRNAGCTATSKTCMRRTMSFALMGSYASFHHSVELRELRMRELRMKALLPEPCQTEHKIASYTQRNTAGSSIILSCNES